MKPTVWLHIGTTKAGSTSLQRAFNQGRDLLTTGGVRYITPRKLTSMNPLAFAIRKNRTDDIAALRDAVTPQINALGDDIGFISSEMLYGTPPETIFDALPVLRDVDLNILVYARRQDKYIESLFLQKSKNGAFRGSILEYIAKFQGSGSDYHTMLKPWDGTHAKLHMRVCEREKLTDSSTVRDTLDIMGRGDLISELPQPSDVNTSPSLRRVQLLHALQDAGYGNIRRIQRNLPPDTKPKARMFPTAQAREFLAGFEAGNEALRAQFYPDAQTLFDMGGLDKDVVLSTGYSDEELADIRGIFKLLVDGQ